MKKKMRDEDFALKDRIEGTMFEQLKAKKKQLEIAEQEKKEEEAAQEAMRKRDEKKAKDKKKTFEELLNESPSDWREFK